MPKISVIVPVYNAEKYLSMTLNSILNQTFSDFELICINDGSKDASLNILNEFQLKDKRLFIINQENQGVSAARNNGITKACGEYIVFFDADDLMHKTFLEKMHKAICADGADVAYCDYENVSEDCAQMPKMSCQSFKIKSYDKPLERYIKKQISPRVMIWNKIYKANIVKKIPFEVKLSYSEDILFTYLYLEKSKKISYLNQSLVFYRAAENSLTRRKFKIVWPYSDIEAFRILNKRLNGKNETYQKFKNSFSKRVVKQAIYLIYQKTGTAAVSFWEEIYDYILFLKNKGELDLKHLNFYRRFLMYLFLHKRFLTLLFILKIFK